MVEDDLKRSVLMSLLLHGAIAAALMIGVPHLSRPFMPPEQTIVVELVNVADITNLPKAARPAKEIPDIQEKKVAEEQPPPPPPPAPAPAEAPPPPEALKPVETKKPEPVKKEEPKKVEKKEPAKKTPLLDKTAKKPEDDFLSVMKTVKNLDEKPAPKKDDLDLSALKKELTAAQGVTTKPHQASMPLSVSQIDAIRKQIEACWNIPAGGRYAESLVVELNVKLDPGGHVTSAKILDSGKMSDPFYRAAAESAQRAILNPQCNTFKLPADRYNDWKEMILRFDPSQMLVY